MTEKETKKKRNKSVSQFVGCPAAPPAGNSATKRPMDQSCPCAAPDSRQLSRPMAPTAIDCHFTSTSNFMSNLLACAKKSNVLSPEFRTHSGNRNQVNASQSADYDSEVRTAGNALELGAT